MATDYSITTHRLGLRPLTADDIPDMHAVSSDPEVMRYFPSTQTWEQTEAFVHRMITLQAERNHSYFAADLLDSGDFIGFIGLGYQVFQSTFTPNIDIGWRLSKKYWGKGYATEGAQGVLNYAWDTLRADKVISIAVIQNTPSINVMKKLGMQYIMDFEHPLMTEYEDFKQLCLYEISKP